MSEELDRKQYQPFHGLRYMESRFGKGGTPVYEFFANVFNMDRTEVDELFELAKGDPCEILAERAYESIARKIEQSMYEGLFGPSDKQ